MFTEEFMDTLADKIAARLATRSVGPALAAAPGKRLLNLNEAATHLGCCASKVRGLAKDGSIPPQVMKQVGRRVMFDRPELEKWVASR